MSEKIDPLIDALSERNLTPDCPPPQVFLATEWVDLTAEQARDIEAHVQTCAVCQAERRLAQTFDEPAAQDDLGKRRLRKALDRTDVAVELTTRPRRRGGVLPIVATAAVLGIVTAVLYMILGQRSLGPTAPTMRGAVIELVAPQADQNAPVSRFEWQAREGAARYELVVRAPDGDPVLRRSSSTTTLTLPNDELTWQRRGTTYQWQVDAYDAGGKAIATSAPARFRVVPTAEEGQ